MTTEFVAKEQGLSMSSDVGDDTTKSLDRQTDESLRVLRRRLLLNPITVGWVSRTSSRVHMRRPAPQGAQGTESCQFFIKIIFTIRPRKMEVKKRKNDVPREKRWMRQQPKTEEIGRRRLWGVRTHLGALITHIHLAKLPILL